MKKILTFLFFAAMLLQNISCAKLEDHALEAPRSELHYSQNLGEDVFFLAFDREGWEVPFQNGSLLSDLIVKRILASDKPAYIHLYSHGWKYDFIEAKKEFLKFIKMTESDFEKPDLKTFNFIGIYLHWSSASRFASSLCTWRIELSL